MARAKVDTKAKEKRQKIILGVAGVLLLGLLAIQGPKLMKQLKGSKAPAAATTTTTSTGTVAPPAAGAGSTATVQLAVLQRSDAPPPASVETLDSFSTFQSKDPFKQQATETTPTDTSTPKTPQAPAAAGGAPTAPTAGGAAGGAAAAGADPSGPVFGTVELPGAAQAPAADGKPAADLPQAILRVNGKRTPLPLGEGFPKAKPVFRLAGFAPGSVELAVVEGSLADGSQTLTLRRRHPVSLVNTVDGTRYNLELLSTTGTKG
jgi:hypothetical protein